MSAEIDTGKQAREDTFNTLLQAGSLPGLSHMFLQGEQDIKDLWSKAAQVKEGDLFVFQVPLDLIHIGDTAARGSGWILANMPPAAHGKVLLTFQGWADDLRELYEIPEVVQFCRVMLLNDLEQPSKSHAQSILNVLVDEDQLVDKIGEQGHDFTGQLWLLSVCFPDEIMVRANKSSTGLWRRLDMTYRIRDWLMGRTVSP